MGRRVEMRTQSADSDLLQRFVYDNYLCIQQLRGAENTLFHSYVWDPTEPIATRPLVFLPTSGEKAYYFHDGNKNVSDLIPTSGTPVHYAYTAFGVATASALSENPIGFSSEFYDISLGLVYYNYRHYNPIDEKRLRERVGNIHKYKLDKLKECGLGGESVSHFDVKILGDTLVLVRKTTGEVVGF